MDWTFIEDFIVGACFAAMRESHDVIKLTPSQAARLRWGVATQELARG